MTWFAIVDATTGRLVSVASVVASPLPAGLVAMLLAEFPADDEMWDEATRTFIARPAKVLVDRLDDLKADPRFAGVLTALPDVSQVPFMASISDLLGGSRFRNPGEPAQVTPPPRPSP